MKFAFTIRLIPILCCSIAGKLRENEILRNFPPPAAPFFLLSPRDPDTSSPLASGGSPAGLHSTAALKRKGDDVGGASRKRRVSCPRADFGQRRGNAARRPSLAARVLLTGLGPLYTWAAVRAAQPPS